MQSVKTMSKTKNKLESSAEICSECRKTMSDGSGLFVMKVLDLDDYKARKRMNKTLPKGGYICREYDEIKFRY